MRRPINQQSQHPRHLLNWLNSTLNTQEVQLEQLGNGVAYCLILHHYFPALVNMKRLQMLPRRQSDNINNLRVLAEAMIELKWMHIAFDVNRVASYSYIDNLQLLTALYHTIHQMETMSFKNVYEQMANKQMAPKSAIQTSKIGKSVTMFPTTVPNVIPKFNGKSQSMEEPHTDHPFKGFHEVGLSSCPATPLKNLPKTQSTVIQKIKHTVGLKDKTDRQKVKELKLLLGIEIQQKINYQDQVQKDLLSDGNKKQAIVITDEVDIN